MPTAGLNWAPSGPILTADTIVSPDGGAGGAVATACVSEPTRALLRSTITVPAGMLSTTSSLAVFTWASALTCPSESLSRPVAVRSPVRATA